MEHRLRAVGESDKRVIENIRLGFATNSSSTHSIVVMSKDANLNTDEYSEFGWSTFTAADKESKSNYFACVLTNYLYNQMPRTLDYKLREFLAREATESLIGTVAPTGSYVDHQSSDHIGLPLTKGELNVEFLREMFTKFTKDPQIVVLGGNDNDDEVHPLLDESLAEFPMNYSGLVVKDPKGYWAIFNPTTGTKFRVNFQSDQPITKSSFPELVDVKLTDYCSMGCAFCYQGSTKQGKHASYSTIEQIISELAAGGTFEIAFGGGEPSEWEGTHYTATKRFSDILRYCVSNRIVGNFTTKNQAWLKTPEAATCLELCGGMAFSISNLAEARQVLKIFQKYKLPRHKLSFQYVLGSNDLDLNKLFTFSRDNCIRVTLLGFKKLNRGVDYPQTDYSNWLELLVKHYKKNADRYGMNMIGIDTALLQQTGESALIAAGVDPSCYTMEEGKFSCYIDAVSAKMYASSYTLDRPVSLHINENRYKTVNLIKQISDGFKDF